MGKGEGGMENPEVVAGPKGREQYHELEAAIHYTFQDPALLEIALTHRSVHPGVGKLDYERLEFLGDAVLDLAIAHLLLDAHPELREGDLSKMRAALVNAASLAELAREIGVGPFIRLSRAEMANHGAERPSILADVFEAIFGAMYREAGFEPALRSIGLLFGEKLGEVQPVDPKTELQEKLHVLGLGAPEYVLDSVEGPEHAPTFRSSVLIRGECLGKGSGPTKKASQQGAAAEALRAYREGINESGGAEEE